MKKISSYVVWNIATRFSILFDFLKLCFYLLASIFVRNLNISVTFLFAMPLDQLKRNYSPIYLDSWVVHSNVHICVRKSTVSVYAIVLSKSESGNQWCMSYLACRNSRNVPNCFRKEYQGALFENITSVNKNIFVYITYIFFICIYVYLYMNTYIFLICIPKDLLPNLYIIFNNSWNSWNSVIKN